MNTIDNNPIFHILEWPCTVEGVTAFNTVRGAVDDADPYSALNLCDYTGDRTAHVLMGRSALCEALGIRANFLVMPGQTHSCRVEVVDEHLMTLTPAQRKDRLQGVDALVSHLGGICIGVNTADCVNISLADTTAKVIGVAHAGWRGTVGKIAARTVEAMVRLGADPKRIVAVMGASICQRCFEVGDEVLQQFVAQGFDERAISERNATTGKAHINLQEANRIVLLEAGLLDEHVAWNGECSRCQPRRYFSARRLGINSGRTFTGVMMDE